MPPALRCESGQGAFVVAPKTGSSDSALRASDFSAVFTAAPAAE